MTFRTAAQSSNSLRSREQNTSGATKRKPRKAEEDPARKIMVGKVPATTRPSSRERSPRTAEMRSKRKMEASPVNKSSRELPMRCALTAVHPCTPLTANSSSGRERSTQQNQHWAPENR
jgi:hypothetical protein